MPKPWQAWTLPQWLAHLEHRRAQEIELGLTRIQAVASQLKLIPVTPRVITVAGTNGKGSTVAALESIYHTAGYQVAAYTSPHLIQFNERIRVNTVPISDEALCLALSIIEEGRGQVDLTYFEMTTLAALWYFKNHDLDLIILEVGLGGRLDATNSVDADLSIITTIDYDHQEFLGTSLESIAYEKAGILRRAKPFIYADKKAPSSIAAVAADLEAPGYFYGQDFLIETQACSWRVHCGEQCSGDLPKPQIQLQSAAAAVVATFLLSEVLPVADDALALALKTLFIPGRLECRQGPVSFLFDVSHNAQSVRLLAATVAQWPKKGRVHAVFSALKDKDLYQLVYPLKPYVDRWYPAQLDHKRAASAEQLQTLFQAAEIEVPLPYSTDPVLAFEAALTQARVGDLIIVYGSFVTVGQVMGNL